VSREYEITRKTPAAAKTQAKPQSAPGPAKPSIREAIKLAARKERPRTWNLYPKKLPRFEGGIYSPIRTAQGGMAIFPATVYATRAARSAG